MKRLVGQLLAFGLWVGACSPGATPAPLPDYAIEEQSLAGLQADLAARRVTSERLVLLYSARIRQLDQNGPTLHSVLAVNGHAIDDARRLDAERAQGHVRGPLHGIPVLIKDNIESADPLPTTAGSLALAANTTGRDAPIVARLREAGAIILGKTNLSEWANFRSTHSTSGWSAVGGLTLNPYDLDRNPCGSSSGSGVAVAANLAAAAVGTETDGSVTCPASVNGLVGIKPTVGLLSRHFIVPISAMQDTAGPMTRTIADAAALLTVMAGRDDADPATRDAETHRSDYAAGLSREGLAGKRLGIMKFSMGYSPEVDALFERAIEQLKAAGAEVVVIDKFEPMSVIEKNEQTVLLTDFRTEIDAYLGTTPSSVTTRSLADLIAFNQANITREMPHFGQEMFTQAEATAHHDAAAHAKLREGNRKAAGPDGIDRLMASYKVDALIAPTTAPAWTTDLVNGDHYLGSATTLAAVAGYPHLSVPMGQVRGLPVGLSIVGPAWSEHVLLNMGYAFEQRAQARHPPALAAPLTSR